MNPIDIAIAAAAFFIGLLAIPILLMLARGFGLYTIVAECEAQVFTLFGKVIGTIDEAGLHFPLSRFGPGLLQKIDNAGVRQWTDSGLEYMPLSSEQITGVTTLPMGDGAVVAWIHNVVPFDNEPVYAIRVDGNGDFVWPGPVVEVGILPTESSRLVGALSSQGFAAYAWSDGDPDILAQNVNGDGSLGPGAIFVDGFESGDTTQWSDTIP